jgi:CPA1 family monovalent cation:H+ antiporter
MLWWSGLRGGVALALALSVPEDLPERKAILFTIFSVVFFTILVQGIAAKPLLEALKLVEANPLRQRYLELISQQIALERVLDYLRQPGSGAGVEPEVHQAQKITIQQKMAALQIEGNKLCQEEPNLLSFGAEQLRRKLLAIESTTYAELVRAGRLTQELPSLLENILEP